MSAAASLSRYGVRSIDGATPADSEQNRAVLSRFIRLFGLCASTMVLLSIGARAITRSDIEYHPVQVIVIALIFAPVVVLEARMMLWAPMWMAHVIAGGASVAVLALTGFLDPITAYLAGVIGYTVIIAGIALVARRTSVMLHGLVILACYSALLSFQDGHVAPAAELWTLAGSMAFVGGLVIWLVALAERRTESDIRARVELEVVSDRQTAFLANMSHELRTPLNAILGFSDLLAAGTGGPLNARQSEYVDDVRSSGQHLLALIDDVLDLAKVEEGKLELELGTVDVETLLTSSATLFRELAGRHRISIGVEADPDVGVIEGDERKLKQVVFNLLSNAVRFTPDGGTVHVTAHRVGDEIEIAVADSGRGVAHDQRERIFEEFHQAGPGSAARQPGTGLGLALVRRFVVLHGGSITVGDAAGGGARFAVRLPVTPPVNEPIDETVSSDRTQDIWRRFSVRSIEGHTEPGSPENRRRVAQLLAVGMSAGVTIVGGTQLAYELSGDGASNDTTAVLVLIGAGLLAAAAFWFARYRIPLAAAHPIGALVSIAITLGAYYTGADHGEIAFGCIAIGIGVATVFELWGALAQIGFLGLCYAIDLHYSTGNFAPVARWLVLMLGTAIAALTVFWLVGLMARLALSERKALAQLELVSRHKSEFLANMSHELRTPLNAIIGFSEVLRDRLFGPLSMRQAEYVNDILEAGRQLLAVINDILDLAKLEAGRMPSEARPVAIGPLLADVARKRRLEVPAPTDARVLADEGQLAQMLDKVVAASPGAERLDVAVDDGFVRVTVARQGLPLFADHDRAFEEFHRGERVGGTGLELPIARALADLHQGRLDLTEERQLELVLPNAAVAL